MSSDYNEHGEPWTAGTPEDLSSVEIIDDLRAENEELRAKLRSFDASEARERLRSCVCMGEAERIVNGLLVQLEIAKAEIEKRDVSISIMTNNLREFRGDVEGRVPPINTPTHTNFFCLGLAVQALKEQLAAKDATIAAQAAEIERLTRAKKPRCEHCGCDRLYSGPPDCPGCGAPQCCEICCRMENLRMERDALRSQLEEQRKRLEGMIEYRFGRVRISFTNNGWEVYKFGDGYLGKDGGYISGCGITWVFKSFEEAYQAAIAANWLPPAKPGEGEG